jgi:hypothetical protein
MNKRHYSTVCVAVSALVVLGCENLPISEQSVLADMPPDITLSNTNTDGFVLWQIGTFDGGVGINPIVASAEYPANDLFFPTFNYTASGVDETPDFPGVISDRKLSDVIPPTDPRPLTDAAETVIIQFTAVCGSNTATLRYDRYGSEDNDLFFDDQFIATVPGSPVEGAPSFVSHTFSVGPISAGSHSIKIVYTGGGANNGHYVDALSLVVSPCDVEIDIKPGSYPNCFNNNGHGVIPVAILGTADFDVTTIDPSTVKLASLAVRAVGKKGNLQAHIEDVNEDGFDDLVVQIEDVDGAFTNGNGTATLTGNLKAEFGGTPIQGTDEICIVP